MALYFPAPEWTGTYIDMAKFGHGRRRGRIHGACDLYAPLESDVKAVTDGIVVEISPIYEAKTQAIAIRHEGIGIIRYGEIVKIPKEIFKVNADVKAGDVIGKVGQVIKLSPMLHFELFDGTGGSGRLSDKSPNIEYYNEGVLKDGNYERRKDLMNPTKFLERLWLEGIK